MPLGRCWAMALWLARRRGCCCRSCAWLCEWKWFRQHWHARCFFAQASESLAACSVFRRPPNGTRCEQPAGKPPARINGHIVKSDRLATPWPALLHFRTPAPHAGAADCIDHRRRQRLRPPRTLLDASNTLYNAASREGAKASCPATCGAGGGCKCKLGGHPDGSWCTTGCGGRARTNCVKAAVRSATCLCPSTSILTASSNQQPSAWTRVLTSAMSR